MKIPSSSRKSFLRYNYRLDFLLLLARIFLPPTVLVFALSIFNVLPKTITSNTSFSILSYVVVYVAYWTAKVQYQQFRNELEAKHLRAVLPVQVRGRWPGNIDVVVDAIKSYKTGYVLEHFERRFQENGCDTLNLRLFWTDLYVTRDHRAIETILTTPNFGSSHAIKTQMYGLFGDGILLSQGEGAKAHRALIRPFLARERVWEFQLFDRYLQKCIAAIHSRAGSNQSIDVQDIFRRFTFDMAGDLLFGTDTLKTLDDPLPTPGQPEQGSYEKGSYAQFAQAFHQLQVLTLNRQRSSHFWPAMEFFRDKTAVHNKSVDAWIMPHILAALDRKRKREGKQSDENEASFVDYLVDFTQDVKLIRDELFNLLLAARDDVASLITFVIYALSIHPHITAKLREEVISIVPEGLPSFDQIREMKYLRAVINETLRLFPPIVLSGRAAKNSTRLPPDRTSGGKPVFIPGNETIVLLPFMLMQRRKDLWGDDADHFIPERWMDEERTSDLFTFLPFSTGPRTCLGKSFAYNQTSFVLIRLLQVFDSFELRQKEDAPPGSYPHESWQNASGRKSVEQIWPRAAVALFAQGGLWVKPSIAS